MTSPTNAAPDSQPLPDVPSPFTMPFYYASLGNCDVYYLVDMARVAPFLQDTGLTPASFGGKALVAYNYQIYPGMFSAGRDVPPDKWPLSGGDFTQELELNIIVYPTHLAALVAQVDLRQFLLGDEQSKTIGNHRVFVPCDSDIAIAAGETLFGEPKFKTSFRANIPSFNPVRASSAEYQPAWVHAWGFRVDDPQSNTQSIFTCFVDLDGLLPQPANPSPITEYGHYQNRMIGCRWNILQPMSVFFLDGADTARVRLELGDSSHPMRAAMQTLIGNAPACAVRTFLSAPAAIQSRAYYP
ncbi:hypothetical protein D9M69_144220 [compost metagenome]